MLKNFPIPDKKIIIFSGAGLDAPSGIKTFRDTGGLWDTYSIDHVCNMNTFMENRDTVFDFYNERRRELQNISPNIAHLKIKELQDLYNSDLINITMNVSDLFLKAGVKDTLHVHGELNSVKCLDCGKTSEFYGDMDSKTFCEKCGSGNIKPGVIFFNEKAPKYMDLYNLMTHLNNPETIIVVIGTSGEVVCVDDFIRHKPCYKILCNKEPSRSVKAKLYDKVYYADITDTIEEICNLITDKF